MISVTRPHMPDRAVFDKFINSIYETRVLTNFGPLNEQLTEKLKDYLEIENLLLVSSGTVALEIALKTWEIEMAMTSIKNIDTTPFSFAATSSAPSFLGYKLNYHDVDETGNIDVRKIQKTSELLLAVNVYGNPNKFKELDEIYHGNVIYDNAHCFGVKSKQNIFLQGYATTCSMHATKVFSTVEGGFIAFKNSQSFQIAKKLANFGYENGNISLSLGINAKLSELHAAYGLSLFEKIDHILSSRRKVAVTYHKNLPNKRIKCILVESGSHISNFAYYPVLFESETDLLAACRELTHNGIYPRRYFYPSLDKIHSVENISCPVSEELASKILCLPIYPDLKQSEVLFICNLIRKSLNL